MYRAHIISASALLWSAALLFSQQPGLSLRVSQYHALGEAVRQLSAKTGWLISSEEPIWPALPQRSSASMADIHGGISQPPVPDTLRVDLPTLRGPNARFNAIKALVDAYNGQNRHVSIQAMTMGEITVLVPFMRVDATGKAVLAQSILSTNVFVPVAKRSPSGHVEALAQAISSQLGIPIDVDTAGFGFRFDAAYNGDPDGGSLESEAEWGTAGTDARTALAAFLSHSKTSAFWQVDCQVGIQPSRGYCALSLSALTVEVRGRSGRTTKRTLYCDRGPCPKMAFPPPPPDPPPGPWRNE
jgi:hypothetical protein